MRLLLESTNTPAAPPMIWGENPANEDSDRDRRGGDTAPEWVRIKRISDVTRDTPTGFVRDNVACGSEVRTNAWTG